MIRSSRTAPLRFALGSCLFAFVITALTPELIHAQNPPPLQTCTVTDIRGGPLTGTFCGGTSSGGNCTSGALYKCDNKASANNCTLLQACAAGCLTTDSPQGKLTEACNNGTLKPLTIAPLNILGGEELTATAQLANPHNGGGGGGVILNIRNIRGDVIHLCDVPNLMPGINSESFPIATSVVGAPTTVNLSADFNWVDATGAGYELSTVPQVVTLQPGGSEPPPPAIATMHLVPTSLDPGGIGFMYVTLDHIAPASGVPIAVTFSDPSAISLLSAPFVPGGCTGSDGRENFLVATTIPKPEVVQLTASSEAAGQAPLSAPLSLTAGCVKRGCSGGPTCGTEPDGCGGVITGCGCFNPQGLTCQNNQCVGLPVFGVKSLTLNPSSVPGGRTSTGTVITNMPAPAGGGIVAIFSDNPEVSAPPTALTIPAGSTTGSFTLTTAPLQSGVITSLIHADDATEATATLTVTPSVSCTPRSCASQAKNCGSLSDGCGGTLSCGSCTGGLSCGGGGVANVCGGTGAGGGTPSTATLTVNVNGGGGDITTTPSAGIKASGGKPASGVFNLGTSITLTTSDGHGAVWSGACSSNGAASQSCTFTFQAAGTVTATNK